MLDWNQYRRELESTISGGLTLETGGESGLLADAGSTIKIGVPGKFPA